MKRLLTRFCLCSAIALGAQIATADFLYCFIGNGDGTASSVYVPSGKVSYDYATVVMISQDGSKTSDYLDFYESGATEPLEGPMASTSTKPLYVGLPDDYETTYNTFLFELWSSGTTAVREAWVRYSLAEVTSNIVKGNSTSGGSPLNVTSVIPEPTGGVLVLLGLAALAVRRKNKGDLN